MAKPQSSRFLVGSSLAFAAIMQTKEIDGRRTEVRMVFRPWKIRMTIQGKGTPQQRRQVGIAIFEMVSKVFNTFESLSWITHPDGYWENIERDQLRGLRVGRGPNIETEAGKTGFEIRVTRLKLGWSQKELAKFAGIDRAHLSLVERGRTKLRDQTRLKIYTAFNCHNPTQSRIGERNESKQSENRPPDKRMPGGPRRRKPEVPRYLRG